MSKVNFLTIPPPVSSVDFNVPFDSPKFDQDDFEDLCAELFEKELGMGFQRYGKKGDKQFGIDLLSDKGDDGFYIAVQCKHVDKFSSSHVDKELEKLKDIPLPIKELYFTATCSISTATVNHCHEKSKNANIPLKSIKIWDNSSICRKIKKYPDIIATYFGLQWRDNLFPNLPEHYQKETAEKLAKELSYIKRKYEILSTISSEKEQKHSGLSIELKPFVEGYVRDKNGIAQFYGDCPSNRGFCLKYSITIDANNGSSLTTMLSVVLTPEDAVDLEAVLLMDLNKQASHSTYFSHDVLLTHISGSTPMLSFPTKDITFMLARNSDYHILLKYVEEYLDKYKDIALSA
jgi:hypothetical protein